MIMEITAYLFLVYTTSFFKSNLINSENKTAETQTVSAVLLVFISLIRALAQKTEGMIKSLHLSDKDVKKRERVCPEAAGDRDDVYRPPDLCLGSFGLSVPFRRVVPSRPRGRADRVYHLHLSACQRL